MELTGFLFFLGLVLEVSGRGGHGGGRVSGRSSSSSGRSSARASVGRSSSSSSSGRSSYGSSGSSSYGSGSRYSSSYGSGSSYRSNSGSSSYSSGSRLASSSILYPSAAASSGGRAYGGWNKRGPLGSREYAMQHQGYESAGYYLKNPYSRTSSSSRSSSTGAKTALAAGAVGLGAGALTTGLVLNSYQEYRELQQQRGSRNLQLDCEGGCTGGAQCVAGLCACPEGKVGMRGECVAEGEASKKAGIEGIDEDLEDVFHNCTRHADCQERDFNMVCNKESELCECREATQWNDKIGECQLSLALDCSHYPSGSKLSPGLLEIAKDHAEDEEFGLLHSLDPGTATAEQLKEAFCRDIDPKGLKLILAALLKEKQAEEVEMNKNGGGGWKISGFSVLVILGIIGLHLFLMVCICCGVKRTCWTCRKARKGFKQDNSVESEKQMQMQGKEVKKKEKEEEGQNQTQEQEDQGLDGVYP